MRLAVVNARREPIPWPSTGPACDHDEVLVGRAEFAFYLPDDVGRFVMVLLEARGTLT